MCEEGKIYANPCERLINETLCLTCAEASIGPCTLPDECMLTCICPPGFVEDETQTCIPIEDCVCRDDYGNKYEPGVPVQMEKECHEW